MSLHRARRRQSHAEFLVASLIALAVAVAGCAGAPDATTGGGADGHGDAVEQPTPGSLPSDHVHGVGVNPGDSSVYLATHDGLFRYVDGAPKRVGPVIDLMGFTVAGPDHFYASGHPGPGVDLPNPVGLIESRDAGQTWLPLSRAAESDFHALTSSAAGVVGFDGALRVSGDRATWKELDPPAAPFSVAAAPDGGVLLGTTDGGLLRSSDSGETWETIDTGVVLMLLAWAGSDTVVGVAPDGTVAVSDDAGATWTQQGSAGGPPQALGAHAGPEGLRVLVATDAALEESKDGGVTFSAYLG